MPRRCRALAASARRSAATAARSRASGRTTSPRWRSRRRSSGRASTRPRSTTRTSAARTRPARTTGTSRGWPCCWPGCRSRSPGVTLNRLCASGLSAVVSASHAIMAGDADVVVAGGVESMSRAPLVMAQAGHAPSRAATGRSGTRRSAGASRTRGTRRCSRSSRWARRARTSPSGGSVSREEQDAFALRSQERWAAAHAAGRFEDEIVAVGEVAVDEHPRPDTSAEKLAGLEARVSRRRDGDGGERGGDQRRRRGARARERGEGAGARDRAARRVRRRRRSPASIRA